MKPNGMLYGRWQQSSAGRFLPTSLRDCALASDCRMSLQCMMCCYVRLQLPLISCPKWCCRSVHVSLQKGFSPSCVIVPAIHTFCWRTTLSAMIRIIVSPCDCTPISQQHAWNSHKSFQNKNMRNRQKLCIKMRMLNKRSTVFLTKATT